MPGVFLSYARKDGDAFAVNLRERLAREAPDIEIKQDRLFLEGGIGWWKQVEAAIDSVEFLVLLMTPDAIASGNVQKEWRYARQQGVCVYPCFYPVKGGAPDADLHFEKMPRWMSKAHFLDLETEWPAFLAHLRKGCDTARVPFMAPDLPPHFVERPTEYAELKNLLLTPDCCQPVAITTALAGAGGFGKTTLAAALCHDEDIIENFDDGILWVTLGQTPDVLRSLLTTYAALTGERPGFAGVEDAAFQLGQKLEERTCLVVIDDVWDAAHLRPFLRGGKSAARLFTTRDARIASEASPVSVDEMREEEALRMLTQGVANLEAAEAGQLARRLGEWPLALELAAAMMRERVSQGDSAAHAAGRLLEIIERKGVRALRNPTAAEHHRTISSVVEASINLQSPDGRRLTELSIFAKDIAIPLAAAAAVWEMDELDAEELTQRLARLSLLKLDLERGVLRLHDVMRSWLGETLGASAEVHSRLVNAWPDWLDLPDWPGEYGWRWLPWHLEQAGRKPEIERILWDPRWMEAKLKATEVNALIADYEHVKPSLEAELVQGALRLSAHVLAADAGQFRSQVVGRLLPHQDSPVIDRFILEVAAIASEPWLRPWHPALHPPGTELIRTLEGHSASVSCVAVTTDGRRTVSASYDKTLKVWDLESGRALRTLDGHSDSVSGVAVTADGRAVSASSDRTLKIWDLESGQELRTLKGHSASVNGVAVTADGKRAVSASSDRTLKVWDLQSGRELRSLEGHSDWVNGVVVTEDGKRAVSASYDKTLKVWDLETGRELRMMQGHAYVVSGVAMTGDGKRAVSASWDQTLKVWDPETGRELRTLAGHTGYATSVAVTGDGKRAVSASSDHTLKVWDLESGQELRTLEAHSASVSGVAVTTDGQRVVSASNDNLLKVWDLESGRTLRTLQGHADFVNGVAVTTDRQRAVSASDDHTLKVWDLESGWTLRTLEGHSGSVRTVAVTADGKRAVSASSDRTLKVWDLENGRELRTLEGHAASVYGVAVTTDGQKAVSASGDKMLKMWDLESGKELRTLEGHLAWVNSVAVTADGQRAVSASSDNTLKLWDLEGGRAIQTLEGHTASANGVALTTDGRCAVSASDDHTLKVWDLGTGHELRTLEGHAASVYGVAVPPHGLRAVSASWDNTLRVWDIETGKVIATFRCDARALCCTFADLHTIVAGDAGGRLYFLRLEQPAGRVRAVGRTSNGTLKL
jgi:WD40 repeat protein